MAKCSQKNNNPPVERVVFSLPYKGLVLHVNPQGFRDNPTTVFHTIGYPLNGLVYSFFDKSSSFISSSS